MDLPDESPNGELGLFIHISSICRVSDFRSSSTHDAVGFVVSCSGNNCWSDSGSSLFRKATLHNGLGLILRISDWIFDSCLLVRAGSTAFLCRAICLVPGGRGDRRKTDPYWFPTLRGHSVSPCFACIRAYSSPTCARY